MDGEDFSDPSDWNNTSLAALYPLDSNLRCLICKDFYTAPVITSCLHTFCSLCIRRSLTAEAVCPACRTTNISDSGLRQNKVVADIVESFLAVRHDVQRMAYANVRPRLLELAQNQPSNSLSSNPPDVIRIDLDKPKIIEAPPMIPTLDSEIRCPICRCPFKTVEQVDLHIDTCNGPLWKSPPVYNFRKPKVDSIPIKPSSSKARPIQPVNPLPKLNYALYNEAKLRTLLAEYGLPTYGNKALLSARHREYVNLYNANIDRTDPQSRPEILKQLEKWDATQLTLARQDKRKELDSEEWGRKCKDEFSELTRLAREGAKRRKLGGQNERNEGTSPSAVRSSQENTIE